MIRRTTLFALMTALVLLSACTGAKTNEERFTEIRGNLNETQEISFKAAIRASYSEKVLEYTIFAELDSEGAELTVLEPELVAGVKATLEEGSVTLNYGGVALMPNELPESEITPLAAPSIIIRALRLGHVVSIARETIDGAETLAVTLLDEFENSHTVWLSLDTGVPLFAELRSGERVVLSCVFDDWSAQ